LALVLALLAVAPTCAETFLRPRQAFTQEKMPPAPDYRDDSAWLALPGRRDEADVVPPGTAARDGQANANVDVFFVHPTTWLSAQAWNARYDEGGVTAERLTQGVLRMQASVFNGCCRVFAPHYRQATLAAAIEHSADAYAAMELAYGDVQRAFDQFIADRNDGRPFFVASHSQGSTHVLRLLQQRIVGTPLAARLVGAYVIGGTVPVEIERRGVAICASAVQTGCLVGWNTVRAGRTDQRRKTNGVTWLDGRYQPIAGRPLVCVNPLDWQRDSTAGATLLRGALPYPGSGKPLGMPVEHLTGAACKDGALEIDIPPGRRTGFRDLLTATGDYHDFDYSLFYMNLRANAIERAAAFARH
jgi:hypothetical protein